MSGCKETTESHVGPEWTVPEVAEASRLLAEKELRRGTEKVYFRDAEGADLDHPSDDSLEGSLDGAHMHIDETPTTYVVAVTPLAAYHVAGTDIMDGAVPAGIKILCEDKGLFPNEEAARTHAGVAHLRLRSLLCMLDLENGRDYQMAVGADTYIGNGNLQVTPDCWVGLVTIDAREHGPSVERAIEQMYVLAENRAASEAEHHDA